MHEISLCESIIELIDEQALAQEFERVQTVFLEVGKLSCVEPEAMRFAFTSVAARTCAEGAKLVIDHLPGLANCVSCGKDVEITERFDVCPECGHYPLTIVSGEQLRVANLEVQ